MRLIPLMEHEAKVYYPSRWYQDQIRVRRQKLIAEGWIVFADEHPNNPLRAVRPVVVVPMNHH